MKSNTTLITRTRSRRQDYMTSSPCCCKVRCFAQLTASTNRISKTISNLARLFLWKSLTISLFSRKNWQQTRLKITWINLSFSTVKISSSANRKTNGSLQTMFASKTSSFNKEVTTWASSPAVALAYRITVSKEGCARPTWSKMSKFLASHPPQDGKLRRDTQRWDQ